MTETAIVAIGKYALKVEENDRGIVKVEILKQPLKKTKNMSTKFEQLEQSAKKFIQGDAHAFDGVSVNVAGTDFQKKVWKATRTIPYGQTRTYAQIAKQIGHPKAVRAVGTALGKNPVCIIVPCHRVVPSSGGIGKYAYGKGVKKWLLDHESGRSA